MGEGRSQVIIKKGVLVHIPVYAMHRHPEFFPEPDSFKPERILPDHHPYAYMPLGAGPKNCVAPRLALMEAKLALLHTVYHYKFSCSNKTKVIIL